VDVKEDIKTGLKNASYLATGNVLTRVIGLIGFVFIARMLGPNDYGIYTTVGTFVGFFHFFLLGGLNKTIIREGSKDVNLMHIYLEIALGIRNLLIVIAILICIISTFFTPYEFQTRLYIIIFSFELVYAGLNTIFGTVYQVTEKMHYISIFGIINRALFVGISIFFLYLGFGVLSLFLIALFSNFLTLIINFRFDLPFRNSMVINFYTLGTR